MDISLKTHFIEKKMNSMYLYIIEDFIGRITALPMIGPPVIGFRPKRCDTRAEEIA